jgi:enolase-phosphatase E1
LKELQGLIWEAGYRSGQLRGEVYPDVPPALQRWGESGVRTAIYSSGSELAQRQLFQSTAYGDLTPRISGFFDTAVGAKGNAASYARIADALRERPEYVLFVSDVVAEITAAASAGCPVVLMVRPGNRPQQGSERFPMIRSFDAMV